MSITWQQLVKLEPRLADLLEEAKAYHKSRPATYCNLETWYGPNGLKNKVCELVGWYRGRYEAATGFLRAAADEAPTADILFSQDAYNVAYDTVSNALPSCACLEPV
jgi:hypothetical protein